MTILKQYLADGLIKSDLQIVINRKKHEHAPGGDSEESEVPEENPEHQAMNSQPEVDAGFEQSRDQLVSGEDEEKAGGKAKKEAPIEVEMGQIGA